MTGSRPYCIAFALAFALVLSPLSLALGRLVSLGEVDILSVDPALVSLHGRITKESEAEYKLERTAQVVPEILLLGSSRVLGIRRELFELCAERPSCFYNAGGQKPTLRHAAMFRRDAASRGVHPRVLLLGLDPWDFIPGYTPSDVPSDRIARDPLARFRASLGVIRDLAPLVRDDLDLARTVLSIEPRPSDRRGLAAIVRSSGFRPDGSYEWGLRVERETTAASPSERVRPLVDAATSGNRPFLPFDDPAPAALDELQRMIVGATSEGATVVLFVPVLPDDVERGLMGHPKLQRGILQLRRALADMAASTGALLAPAWSAQDVGCSNDEFWDPVHASEVCAARTVRAMLDVQGIGDVLAPYVSGAHVERLIGRRMSPLRLFPAR